MAIKQSISQPSRGKIFIYTATAVVLSGILLRVFILDSFTVSGNSMAPTVVDGDYVFVNKLAYTGSTPQRDDVVVFNFRQMPGINAIKRVIGLPGDWLYFDDNVVRIEKEREGDVLKTYKLYDDEYNGKVTASSSHYRLDPYEYFLVGDNGLISKDSRDLGPVDIYHIQGRAIGVLHFPSFTWESL